MAVWTDQSDHARAIWFSCMASAFRTALACVIVGCVTLFGPASLNDLITLPAFSYVTVILIVTDATLGDTLRGCWHALYASLFGIFPAILTLWVIGPARMTDGVMAAAVAASGFSVVVVQENSHLITKRIALGQIVLVYVFALISGSQTDPVMHPVGVLVSTAVGVVACVLALLLPYPSLATSEVKKNFKLFTMNASERLKIFVKAFSAEDKTSAHALISQAKCLARMGIKFLRTIKSKQEGMLWERLPVYFFKPYCVNPVEKLQHLETPLRGMEMALSNSEPYPVRILNSDLKAEMVITEERVARQIKSMPLVSATTMPENTVDHQHLAALQSTPMEQKDLPSFFFLFCLNLLQKKSMAALPSTSSSKTGSTDAGKKEDQSFKGIWRSFSSTFLNSKRLMPAFKSALSLGLAVFLGALYSKENAHWAGLPVAISLAAAREATFKVANLKAQGTVLGTVYGVFGCFIFQKYVVLRLLSLLPWFIFCSFLRRSRMYGQAGGISAVIGAVLILGRKNFGPPTEFAIVRITETFIGLSCSIAVDILFQPTRAAVLAKLELSQSLQLVRNSVGGIRLSTSSKANLDESLKKLKTQVTELGKFIGEAAVEPNFWFLPFHSACYGKLLESLSKTVDFISFATNAIEFLHQESSRTSDSKLWKENVERLNHDLNSFKHLACNSMVCSEGINLLRSVKSLEKEIQRKNISIDLESGKPTETPSMITFSASNEEMIEKNFSTYLQHCREFLDGIKTDKKELKGQLVLSLSALGFCINGIITETKEIEKGIKELVQWENPSSHVDLKDISTKINALAMAAAQEQEGSN